MLGELSLPLGAEATDSSPPAASARKFKIVVDGIEKTFKTEEGALKVIDPLSFSVAEGEAVAIVGPSGCGKSTLMNILAGFDRPDRDGVSIDGVASRGAGPHGVVISQEGSVFPWMTVRENAMFGMLEGTRAEKCARADRYLALVGLQGFERRYPHELSGGMLKRVEIARALAVEPDILYMDEPFSALDALMSLRLRTELLGILKSEGKTLVLITHDVEEAIHLADRVLVLTSRPTRIKRALEIGLPHPRRLTSPEAQSLKEAILRELGL